jgi:hypothetical protein
MCDDLSLPGVVNGDARQDVRGQGSGFRVGPIVDLRFSIFDFRFTRLAASLAGLVWMGYDLPVAGWLRTEAPNVSIADWQSLNSQSASELGVRSSMPALRSTQGVVGFGVRRPNPPIPQFAIRSSYVVHHFPNAVVG